MTVIATCLSLFHLEASLLLSSSSVAVFCRQHPGIDSFDAHYRQGAVRQGLSLIIIFRTIPATCLNLFHLETSCFLRPRLQSLRSFDNTQEWLRRTRVYRQGAVERTPGIVSDHHIQDSRTEYLFVASPRYDRQASTGSAVSHSNAKRIRTINVTPP